jgi:hypothetical protein
MKKKLRVESRGVACRVPRGGGGGGVCVYMMTTMMLALLARSR